LLTQRTQNALDLLQASARKVGIEIAVASGYRSVERQTLIWQRKAAQDYCFEIEGRAVPARELNDEQWLAAVMQWSAVPGLSRHHWGTDLDIYDSNALPMDYQLQLTPEEYSASGIFSNLHYFLNDAVDQRHIGEFFRPYRSSTNAISPEAWHLSFAPEAEQFNEQLDIDTAAKIIPFSELRGGALLKNNLEEILERYVKTYDLPD